MATNDQEKALKEKCLKLLRQYTKHEIIKITNSGDSAIFGALSIAKQHGCAEILIPDQGGWLSYQTFPKLLDIKITELKTNYGIIEPEELEKEAKKHKEKNKAFRHCDLIRAFSVTSLGKILLINFKLKLVGCEENTGNILFF
mgnify:CR=1 FL=1